MSSAPAPSRAAPPPAAARAAPPPSAVAHPAPTAVSPASAMPQQPSMFQQMAATAGGVAIGSAVVRISNQKKFHFCAPYTKLIKIVLMFRVTLSDI